MLRRTPSLALRAVLTFTGVYMVTVAIFLTVVVVIQDPHRDRQRHIGPKIALTRAAEDLARTESGFRIRSDGGFAEMASRNPAIWFYARSGDQSFSFGRVPASVASAFEPHGLLVQSGRFYVRGLEGPLASAAVERRRIGSDSVLLAAGGVDPETLESMEILDAYFSEGILVWLARTAVMAFVAMLLALPILSRALRPLAAEAASILPQEPERRLDEKKAPREVLPLVRGFNAALDRLASELGRRKRFIADAAHELRTPLAVVALRVEALKDETDKQELRRGLGRLVHLVSQMLDIERLSLSGRERVPVDLAGIARDVVADLAPTAIKSGYDLSLEAPSAPVMVTGDAHAISRAITNLIGNSIAHGGGTGQIRVVVGADRTIDVIDEGPGVPAALQPRLFEPFSRGSSDADGCGLGLHLTREIMRAHGGDVWLVPSERGAVFRLGFAPQEDESRA
jgi:signal transduction histidine kinase